MRDRREYYKAYQLALKERLRAANGPNFRYPRGPAKGIDHPKRPIPKLTEREIKRFYQNIIIAENGCLEWAGTCLKGPRASKEWRGYGYFKIRRDGRSFMLRAHRVLKAIVEGDNPALEIDHLCRNTRCINPAHTEYVTRAENLRRRTRKTVCKHGHDISTPEGRMPDGRHCKTCDRIHNKKRWSHRSPEA